MTGSHTRIDHALEFGPFAGRSTVLLDGGACVQQRLPACFGAKLIELVGKESGITGARQLMALANSESAHRLKRSLCKESRTRDRSPESCEAGAADVTVDGWDGVVHHALRVRKASYTGKKNDGQEEERKHDCGVLTRQLPAGANVDDRGNTSLRCSLDALISSTHGTRS